MNLIDEFFLELDRKWQAPGGALPRPAQSIPLRVIGAAALMLQTGYNRGTKDADVLEVVEITEPVKDKLSELAGPRSELGKKYRLYLDIVKEAIPFLPTKPAFHPVKSMKGLRNFTVEALDITDVVVSKLKRFNANDAQDIRAMADQGRVKHARLLERFRRAVDRYSVDARAEDLPKYVTNLHAVERDYFLVKESIIDLPGWL